MQTSIQYEDKDILVVYKPAGLATQTAKVGQKDVVSELKNYLKGGYVGVVHRLDQPVEGLLVFAKNKASAAALTAQLSKGTLHKHYYAVICGQPAETEAELVDYLTKTSDNRAQVSVPGGDAKKAVLHYKILESVKVNKADGENNFPNDMTPLSEESVSRDARISLTDVVIQTGRFHQIRVQLSHAGFPLLGDQKYGTVFSGQLGKELNVRNVALCACELTLEHPVTHKKLNFQVKPQGIIFSRFSIL